MKLVEINDVSGAITEDFQGSHVLLSIEEYNTIIRQLNNIKLLIMEQMTYTERETNGILRILLKHQNEIITK